MSLYSNYYTKTLNAYNKVMGTIDSAETLPELATAQEMCNSWTLLVKSYYEDLRRHRHNIKTWKQTKNYGNLVVTMYQSLQEENEIAVHQFDAPQAHEGYNKPVKIKNIYE